MNYDFIIKCYGITFTAKNDYIYGNIDYIGKPTLRKRLVNSFIVYPNKKIAYDFPYDIPKYLHEGLKSRFC